MNKVLYFAVFALFAFSIISHVSAQSLECDMACAIELENGRGDNRSQTVIANCGPTLFSENGFKIRRAIQPTGCNCRVRAYCGYDQKGKSRTYVLGAGKSLNLPFSVASVSLECTA